MLTMPGEISLCCVVPEAQGFGVERAMLAALETEALRRSLVELNLRSTETAHHFYLDYFVGRRAGLKVVTSHQLETFTNAEVATNGAVRAWLPLGD